MRGGATPVPSSLKYLSFSCVSYISKYIILYRYIYIFIYIYIYICAFRYIYICISKLPHYYFLYLREYLSIALKKAKVIPLFKYGDRSKPENYRPISLLYIYYKLENLTKVRIFKFVNKFTIIRD